MKPAFQLYHEDMETIEDLSDEDLGRLVRLLNAYSKGEEVDVPDDLKFPFRFMAKKIDKDTNAYQERVKKTKKAAEMRWQEDADASEEVQENADASKDMQVHADASECMQMDGTELNRTELNRTELNRNNNNSPTPAARQSDFERLWSMYPNKQGKDAAFKAFKRAIHDGDTVQDMEKGIKAYCDQIRIKRTDKEFIKHGSTFFNQRCWHDTFDMTPSAKRDRPEMDFLQRNDDMSGVFADI